MDGSEHKTNETESSGAPLQLSDAIERLLANPELISTVASAIGAQAPAGIKPEAKKDSSRSENSDTEDKSGDTPASTQAEQKDISSKLPELMASATPMIAALSGKNTKLPDDDRTRLLCALKPYVNPHRKEAIDTIVNLARISEVIKTIK